MSLDLGLVITPTAGEHILLLLSGELTMCYTYAPTSPSVLASSKAENIADGANTIRLYRSILHLC